MAIPAPDPATPHAARYPTGSLRRISRRIEVARLALEIVLAHVKVRRALRGNTPVDVVLATLRPDRELPRSKPLNAEVTREIRHIAHAVTRTLALLPGDTRCLTQALVLSSLLANRAIATTLVIGAHSAPGFAAHAWVEHEGRPILPAGDGLFETLAEL
jgi:hypothetical protein